MIYSMEKWTLINQLTGNPIPPRPVQIDIINKILSAIDQGYKNIILEAGTGIGKSVCATTISNYFNNSYIITMTNQLLQQYLHDFDYMVNEIKGRSNYHCNYGGSCEECNITKVNRENWETYLRQLKEYNKNPSQNVKPEKPIKLNKCTQPATRYQNGKEITIEVTDCPYVEALQEALTSKNIITNYDYLYYAGNYAGILQERDLIIFDESHNFENKIMQLTVKSLNRKTIYNEHQIDIFDGITEHNMTLKKVKTSSYWINVLEKLISDLKFKQDSYAKQLEKELLPQNPTENDFKIFQKTLSEDDVYKGYQQSIDNYSNLINVLDDWVIEIPTKKEILNDKTYLTNTKEAGLTVEFKPLTVDNYTETLLHFGETRLFMTGTLGSKDLFCRWVGIDPKETYHIYVKSPFPVENRPIFRLYSGDMSRGNWRNEEHLIRLHDILEDHKDEKGVIHVSSKEQAWWIRNELNEYLRRPLRVASGKRREEIIEEFECNDGNMVLISPSVKDGVDFKGDKCRFQVIYKCPFPMLKGEQVNRRKNRDVKWYIYQTVMPLMQAYGRGIRDETDYCVTYVLDKGFDGLLNDYTDLFNEYFLEAVDGFDWRAALKKCKDKRGVRRVRRVRRTPRVQSEAK